MMISLIFYVSEELGVNEGVLLLVSIHAHHGANCAARNDDQENWNPDEGLDCDQVRVLLTVGDVGWSPCLVALVVKRLSISYIS